MAMRWGRRSPRPTWSFVTEIYAAREQPMPGRERAPGGRRGRQGGCRCAASSRRAPTVGRRVRDALRARRRGAHPRRGRHHAGRARAGAVAERRLTPRLARGFAARPRWLAVLWLSPSARCCDTWNSSGCGGSRSSECSILMRRRCARRARSSRRRASVFDDHAPLASATPSHCRASGTPSRSAGGCPGTLRDRVDGGGAGRADPEGRAARAGGRERPRCCRSIRSASAPDLPVLIGGGRAGRGRAGPRCEELDPGALRANRRGVAGRARRGASRWGDGWFWFGAGLTAEDIRAVTAVEQDLARKGRAFAGARRAVRRPGRRAPGRGHEHAAAAAGRGASTSGPAKVVGAHRRGDRRRAGARRPDPRASGSSAAPGSGAAWCATSRRPPAPSTRR